MSLRTRILGYLQDIQIAAQVAEIAEAIGAAPRNVQVELHRLDDDDLVIMKNGWYLASHKGMAYPLGERGP